MMTARLVSVAARNMARSGARPFSRTSAARVDNVHPGYKAVKEKQKMFQLDDGLRIHEKTQMNRNLYMFTKLLIVISTVEWARQYWTASKLWVSLGLQGPE